MRLFNDNKGQIRIIEAFFASILLLSSLTLVPSDTHVEDSNSQVLRSTAQQTLTTLDNDGTLSRLIENRSWTALRKCVQSLLSPAVWFNLTIFDENMNPINQVPICNGGLISERVVATEYVCASSSRDYKIYVARLQLSVVN